MRPIDADALRDKLQNLAYEDWNQGVITSWANAYNECADIVDDMPTVEPPRMKGKWIPQGWNDTYCKCSCCDAVYVTAKIPYSFCPNCGADMREMK